jgi:hypothetical protein
LVHAFHISRSPIAIGRAFYNSARLTLSGGTIFGNTKKIRLSFNQVARAFGRAFQHRFL